MTKSVLWLVAVFFLFHAGAVANTNIDSPSIGTSLNLKQLKEVGKGQMSVLWFDVYRARLLSPQKEYQPQLYPQVLEITYLRKITAADLVDATVEQWQHLQYSAEDIESWKAVLVGLWPDVDEQHTLAFAAVSKDKGHFYFNGQPLGTITEAGFADAFVSIWLSEQSSQPALRAQLIGEKSCDC